MRDKPPLRRHVPTPLRNRSVLMAHSLRPRNPNTAAPPPAHAAALHPRVKAPAAAAGTAAAAAAPKLGSEDVAAVAAAIPAAATALRRDRIPNA